MTDIRELYTEGQWKGEKNYECRRCPYKTLALDRMTEHIMRRHSPKEPVVPVEQPIYDRFGNRITERPPTRAELEAMTKDDLQELASSRGVSTSGTKAEIVDRLSEEE